MMAVRWIQKNMEQIKQTSNVFLKAGRVEVPQFEWGGIKMCVCGLFKKIVIVWVGIWLDYRWLFNLFEEQTMPFTIRRII